MYFAYLTVLRVLDLCYKVAIFELELRKCTSRTRRVLRKLRLSSWSCGSVLRALGLYYKVAIFRAGAAEVYFAH